MIRPHLYVTIRNWLKQMWANNQPSWPLKILQQVSKLIWQTIWRNNFCQKYLFSYRKIKVMRVHLHPYNQMKRIYHLPTMVSIRRSMDNIWTWKELSKTQIFGWMIEIRSKDREECQSQTTSRWLMTYLTNSRRWVKVMS